MGALVDLADDMEWFLKACNLTKKKYDEQSKIMKQNPANTSPIFVSHMPMKKRFLLSFIQPYHGQVAEVNFEQLKHFVNPTKFKNGLLVISKYPALTNGYSQMNGADSFGNNETSVFDEESFSTLDNIDIPVNIQEFVQCGTLFSASEIFALGKKDFHGSLGPIKKASMNLDVLEPLSTVEARYASAMITQAAKTNFDVMENKTFLIHCEPSKPNYAQAFLLYPETLTEKKYLRIMQVREDDGRASKAYRTRFEEGSYTASYDILKGLLQDNNNSAEGTTSLKAVFCWPTSRNQMDTLPPHSSKSVLQVQVALGEQQSALNEMFLEITKLDSIANTTLSELSNDEGTMSFDIDQLYENLTTFKESVSNFSFYGVNDEKSDDNNDDLEKPMAELIRQSFQRNDSDFTDKLWLFLRSAEGGFQEMKFCLDDIINDIVHGSLQPAVSPMNQTKLAKLVRKMYTEESEEAKLPMKEKIMELVSTDSSLVNLITEIGFEKIRKDYYHYFVNNEMAILPALDKMRGKQQIGLVNHANDIVFLWKLHFCMEIVITPTVYLRLDHDSQRSLLSAALEYYTIHSVSLSSPVFCLSLLPVYDTLSNVLNSCTARLPDIWKEGILKTNRGGVREVCITCQENNNSITEENMTSASVGPDEKSKNTQVGYVLCESVIELPN